MNHRFCTPVRPTRHRQRCVAAAALALCVAAASAQAQGSEAAAATSDTQRLRSTPAALIRAMQQQGLITAAKAEELLRAHGTGEAAPSPAAAATAVVPTPSPSATATAPAAAPAPVAKANTAPAPQQIPTVASPDLRDDTGLRIATPRYYFAGSRDTPQPAEPPTRADRVAQAAAPAPAAAAAAPAPAAPAASGPQWGTPATRTAQAGTTTTNTVRVPFISETLRAQIKDEIKNEVFATAREENWADSRKLPDWVSRITIDGDVRVRAQNDRFAQDNLPPADYRSQTESPAWSPDITNTQTDRRRFTLRARLGITAKVSDDVGAGLRITTGNPATGPTSSSVNLGNGFNKLQTSIDRAWIRWEPRHDLRLDAGRMAVPFFGTDLLWPDDLSVDGVALRYEPTLGSGLSAFVTAGVFPIEELATSGDDKWLVGLQLGMDWALGSHTQLRFGVGVYDFQDVQGVRENAPPPSGPRAGTTAYQWTQYPASIRQRGNTLINLNDPTSTAAPVWGLASKFRPINVTAGATFTQFAPVNIGVTLDYVKNSAFDIADITRRAGTTAVADLADKTTGLQLRTQFGALRLANKGDWNAFFALRHFERDAWLDAFTDTTWHLGGTNYKGYSLGGNYAFDRNTTAGLRWTSTKNLDDGRRFLAIPGDPTSLSGNLSSAPLKIEVFQVELSTRF
jgi:Putative porin